jgi:protein-tyrosine phosphatase
VIVGLGYIKIGPSIYGKQQDGRLRIVNILVLLPFLLFTWLIWHIQRMLTREACWNEVSPGLYVGRRAFLYELPSTDVLIIDLTAEFPAPRSIRLLPGYRCLPTLDATVPLDITQMQKLVSEAVNTPGRVYIHCANGHGRSVTLAAVILLERRLALNPLSAVTLIKSARPAIRLNSIQLNFLDGWSKYANISFK